MAESPQRKSGSWPGGERGEDRVLLLLLLGIVRAEPSYLEGKPSCLTLIFGQFQDMAALRA